MEIKLINYIKKNKIGLLLIGLAVLVLIPLYINSRIIYNEIEKQGTIGIGKFVLYKDYPKSRDFYFDYYKGKTKIRVLIKKPPNGFSKNLNSFYEIKYLYKHENVIVNYNKKITDTTLILKAGFSKEDIVNMPK